MDCSRLKDGFLVSSGCDRYGVIALSGKSE